MKFFPSQAFVLNTNISANSAWNNLSESLSNGQNISTGFFSRNQNTAPFKGHVFQGKFNIQRNLSYRNSFQAGISGEIFEDGSGSKIEVSLNLAPFVKVFLIIWCSFTSIFCIMFLFGAINAKDPNLAFGSLIPLGMLGFCYLIVSVGFKSDCEECRRALNVVFKVESQSVFQGKGWKNDF
ncbi:hypothetical protein G7074_09300 [Pedobacter sp. HDW13]|uniref:hypothetical protein n=1 Tax=Pedobacter sp. HDW13 TaxID=2714940 RepID=UPI001409A5CD|nr:hypothetical protein [Pedobacter sp. HDW13]QIL39448.1 hypothetical protein G7074_09300 [Pedobacter sp. HDW13]